MIVADMVLLLHLPKEGYDGGWVCCSWRLASRTL
jgi:hypothetical protein